MVMDLLTKEECEKALENISNLELQEYEGLYGRIKYVGDIRFCDYMLLRQLIKEHFDNTQINWLKNCMEEEAFNLIFSSQEEVNKWFDRMRWHVKKCNEYGRELDILKNNPPLKFEELKEGVWIWDIKRKQWMQVYSGSYVMHGEKWLDVYTVGYDEVEDIKYEDDRFYRKECYHE